MPAVEKFYEDIRDLLTQLANDGYILSSMEIEWSDFSTQSGSQWKIKSISADINHRIK